LNVVALFGVVSVNPGFHFEFFVPINVVGEFLERNALDQFGVGFSDGLKEFSGFFGGVGLDAEQVGEGVFMFLEL